MNKCPSNDGMIYDDDEDVDQRPDQKSIDRLVEKATQRYQALVLRQYKRRDAWIEKTGKARTHQAYQTLLKANTKRNPGNKPGRVMKGKSNIERTAHHRTGYYYEEIYRDWREGYAKICEDPAELEADLRKEAEALFPIPDAPEILENQERSLHRPASEEETRLVREAKEMFDRILGRRRIELDVSKFKL